MENSDTLDAFSIHFDESLPALTDTDLPTKSDTVNKWDPRLILDLAVGIDSTEDILHRYNLSEEEYENLSKVKSFRQELALMIRDVRENGVSFARKAAVQAESYLEDVHTMITDPTVAAGTKLDAIKSTVLWGRLLPEKETKDDALNATQINVSISF
jgi:hypothetical protein